MEQKGPSGNCLEETVKELQTSGIIFCVQYIGSVVVEKSMNTLSPERQTEVARACMRFVVREAMPNMEPMELDEKVANTYVHGPVLSHNGEVEMNVSTSTIILIDTCSCRVLNRFKIPDVSVLSPGSDELASFFCFVAKMPGRDGQWVRKCFVFKAKDEQVLVDVRDMICFAFRLNASAARDEANITPVAPTTPTTPMCGADMPSPSENGGQSFHHFGHNLPEIRVSSDSALVVPPELPPRPRRSLNGTESPKGQKREGRRSAGGESGERTTTRRATMGAGEAAAIRSNSTSPRDDGLQISPMRYKEITRGLDQCSWYHGTMPRLKADSLVQENGQFLVRRSPNIEDQFVLVGMHDGRHRHVTLIGRGGKILTTIGEFTSIVHLIDYFHRSRQPMVLQDVQLVLHTPINRPNGQ